MGAEFDVPLSICAAKGQSGSLKQLTRELESTVDKQESRLQAMRTELQPMNTVKAFGNAFPRREPLAYYPPPDSPFCTDALGPPGFGNVFGVNLH